MSLNIPALVDTAVREAQLQGLETLNEEQFDALFLMARGIGAIKQKYANHSVGLDAALMQEDILSLIGIGLNKDYILAKKQLEEKINKRKEELPSRLHGALDEFYVQQIAILRKEYKVDAEIENTLKHFVENSDEYVKIRNGYAKHISMHFIEEDIDVKVKAKHESNAEFKTKQALNKNLGLYKGLRAPFLEEKQEIEREYEDKLKEMYGSVQNEISAIENEYKIKLEQHQLKYKKLDGTQALPVEQEEFVKLELEGEALIKERDKKIMKLKEGIDVNALHEEKKEKLEQNQIKHKDKLKEAEALFDDKIFPLLKELKAQEAHKMFVVIANQMSLFIEHNGDDLKQADSNTIAFVALLKELVSDLRIFGVVHHVGMAEAQRVVESETSRLQESEKSDPSRIEKILAKAAEKAAKSVARKVGDELGKAGAAYSKKAFKRHVKFLEQNVVLRIPAIVKEHDSQHQEAKTFVDYLPPGSAVKKTKEPSEFVSFFDFVEHFNNSKGVLGAVDTGLKVYEALSARNPDIALIDVPNPAYLFAKALEDGALAFNYKLLVEYEKMIDALAKYDSLGENAPKWKKLQSDIKDLMQDKEKLDALYKELKDSHYTFRKAYTEAQKPYDAKKAKIESLKERRVKLKREIKEERQSIKIKEAEIFKQEVSGKDGEKLIKIKKAMEELGKEYEQKVRKVHHKSEKDVQSEKNKTNIEKQKLEKKQREHLKGFDETTEAIVIMAIKEEHEKQNGFFKTVIATKKDLEEFYKNTPALKEKIEALRDERKQERERLEKSYAGVIKKLEEKLINTLLPTLEEEKQTLLSRLEKEKANKEKEILKPYSKFHAIMEETERKTKALEGELNDLEGQIANEGENLKILEANMIEISREFYAKVEAFNEAKEALNNNAKELMSDAVKLDPGKEPHLRAMQGIIKSPQKKIGVIAKVAKQLPATIMDEIQLQTMSYDAVAKRVMTSREVKEVMMTAEEKSLAQRMQENLAQVGAHSIVDVVSSRVLPGVRSYISKLEETLQAEQALKKAQKEVDKRADDLILEQQKEMEAQKKAKEEIEAERLRALGPIPVEMLPQKRQGLERIGDFFRGLRYLFMDFVHMLIGKPDEQKRRKVVLEAAALKTDAFNRPPYITFSRQSKDMSVSQRMPSSEPAVFTTPSKPAVSTTPSEPAVSTKSKGRPG